MSVISMLNGEDKAMHVQPVTWPESHDPCKMCVKTLVMKTSSQYDTQDMQASGRLLREAALEPFPEHQCKCNPWRQTDASTSHPVAGTHCAAGSSKGVGGKPTGVALLTGSLASTFCFRCRAENLELPPGSSTGTAPSILLGPAVLLLSPSTTG